MAPSTQRGGESFARKRDRAKLLRQQMNDGLDNLHEVGAIIHMLFIFPAPSVGVSGFLFREGGEMPPLLSTTIRTRMYVFPPTTTCPQKQWTTTRLEFRNVD